MVLLANVWLKPAHHICALQHSVPRMGGCCLQSPPGPDYYSSLTTSLESVPETLESAMTHCSPCRYGEHRCESLHDGNVTGHVYKVPGWCSFRQWGQCAECHKERSQNPAPPGSTSPQRSRSDLDLPPLTPLVMHCPLMLKEKNTTKNQQHDSRQRTTQAPAS